MTGDHRSGLSLGSLEVCVEDADPSLAIGLGGCVPFRDVWPKAALFWLVGGSCDQGKLRRHSRISHLFYAWKRRVRLVQPRCHAAWCWGQLTSIKAHRRSPGAPLLGRDRFTDDLWWWAHGINVLFNLSSLANLWVVSFSDSRFTRAQRVIFEAVTPFMNLQRRLRMTGIPESRF